MDDALLGVLDAVVDRLLPGGDGAPGAREARVGRYIERLLEEDDAQRSAYTAGLRDVDRRSRATFGASFVELPDARRDEILEALERESSGSGAFFDRVRRHTIEGMFGDPAYGGNDGGSGWVLLGYPGPRAIWAAGDQELGERRG